MTQAIREINWIDFDSQSPSLQQLTSLYVCRSKTIWRDTEILPWLERNVNTVLDRVDAKEEIVNEYSTKRSQRWERSRSWIKTVFYDLILFADTKHRPEQYFGISFCRISKRKCRLRRSSTKKPNQFWCMTRCHRTIRWTFISDRLCRMDLVCYQTHHRYQCSFNHCCPISTYKIVHLLHPKSIGPMSINWIRLRWTIYLMAPKVEMTNSPICWCVCVPILKCLVWFPRFRWCRPRSNGCTTIPRASQFAAFGGGCNARFSDQYPGTRTTKWCRCRRKWEHRRRRSRWLFNMNAIFAREILLYGRWVHGAAAAVYCRRCSQSHSLDWL